MCVCVCQFVCVSVHMYFFWCQKGGSQLLTGFSHGPCPTIPTGMAARFLRRTAGMTFEISELHIVRSDAVTDDGPWRMLVSSRSPGCQGRNSPSPTVRNSASCYLFGDGE